MPNDPKVMKTNELKIVSLIIKDFPKIPVIISAAAKIAIIAKDANPTMVFSLNVLSSLKMSLKLIILFCYKYKGGTQAYTPL